MPHIHFRVSMNQPNLYQKHLFILLLLFCDYLEIWELCFTVCYYHVTYKFQNESTLYSWLNVKQLLAQNRRDSWSLSDSNEIRTHNHLVCRQTLNHLSKQAKWLSCVVSTYLYGVFDCYYHDTRPALLNGWVFAYELSGCGFKSLRCHLNSRYRACFEHGVLDIQATIECRFTLKCERDMIIIYSQMHRTDKHSQLWVQVP